MNTDQTNSAADKRYGSLDYLAAYLHAEWSDVLFSETSPNRSEKGSHVELLRTAGDSVGTGSFYREAADAAARWAQQTSCTAQTVCDIGGGTGRFIRELATRFPQTRERLFVEPSGQFRVWAQRILAAAPFDGWIPQPAAPGSPTYRQMAPGTPLEPIPRLEISDADATHVPRPDGYFDLVTCLNVVDRVDDPVEVVRRIGRLVRPGGLLVLASPHDYNPAFTPPGRWCTDLSRLLDQTGEGIWSVGDRECDLRYAFLNNSRRYTQYLTQVVGAVKRP